VWAADRGGDVGLRHGWVGREDWALADVAIVGRTNAITTCFIGGNLPAWGKAKRSDTVFGGAGAGIWQVCSPYQP
jgi:hypothetical protein